MSEVIAASPNEAEAIRLEEFRRARLQRLLQVRDAERQRSKTLRSHAEEQVALARGDLKARVTREVSIEFRQAIQNTRQRLRSAETSVGESFAAAQQHQEVLAVEARADYEALSRSVHVAAQRHQAAVQVEAAISSTSPTAVTRQRAQRMANVRQEAAQESVSWASSRPPVQPKFNEMPKPAATRRHKPADASAFHTSHHHFGSGLLYPHSGPNVEVVRHPRSSADSLEAPIIKDESTQSAPAPASTKYFTPDVGRRAFTQQSSLAQSFQNAAENLSISRVWPQPRGLSSSHADDDQPTPLPAPQPRMAPLLTSVDCVKVTTASSTDIQPRIVSSDASHLGQYQTHASKPVLYAESQFIPSSETPTPSQTAASAPAAPAALPLKLVSGDGRLTMSATEIAQRIAELHRVRAAQEEAKLLKQESTITSRGRNAAAFLRQQSEAKSANAAVEQVIKHAEQTRRQAARAIATPVGSSTVSVCVPENVREKAFERLLFQPATAKHSSSGTSHIHECNFNSHSRTFGRESGASDSVAQPLPSSLSLRGAILRDSSIATISSNSVIVDAVRNPTVNSSEASTMSPSKKPAHVNPPMPSESDSTSDSLDQQQQQHDISDSSSASDDLWPPARAIGSSETWISKQPSRRTDVSASREISVSNADAVLMSDSSSSSTSPSSSPIRASRIPHVDSVASPKTHALGLASAHHNHDSDLSHLPRQHQMNEPHPSLTAAPRMQPSSLSFDSRSPRQSSSPKGKSSHDFSDAKHINNGNFLSPQSAHSKKLGSIAPLRSSAPASFEFNAPDIHPELSKTAPSPTRMPVSPAHARVRILIPTAPISPEPAAIIRSPPASNISTPSDLQSPSLLQHVNILRDLRGSPIKGAAFHHQNSSFGEAATLAAMDDYSARGSIDDKLHARLSSDTWMRLSQARSSVASLEYGNYERTLSDSSTLLPPARSEIDAVSDASDEEDARVGKSAAISVRQAIERFNDNCNLDSVERDNELTYSAETRESKSAPRVAWKLPSSEFVLASNQSTVTASDGNGASTLSTTTGQSHLDPSFWLTSFGAQHCNDVSTDSSEPEDQSHVLFAAKASILARSPQAVRHSPSTRSSVSASSASASNSSIREAIESYRKATMFVMPPDISSDTSDDDSRSHGALQHTVISSDSESDQSVRQDGTIDYLNRRVRIERDQLLQTAGNRARSSQSLHYSDADHGQRQSVSSKHQSHRRVAFAPSVPSKSSNYHSLPHELRHIQIIAETERRWKNLPEVKRQMHAHEAAKSLEAARQKAKLDAEILRRSLLSKQNMRKPRASTPPSRPFKP